VRRRGSRPTGRIAFRIFAFNALLAFLPVAAFSLLDTYEKGLVAALEHALAQQARVTAAWLGQAALTAGAAAAAGDMRNSPNAATGRAAPRLDAAAARKVLAAIGDKRTARFRIVDTEGRLLADSSDREVPSQELQAAATGRSSGASAAEEGGEPFLYRVFSMPSRAWRRFLAPPTPPIASADYYASAGPVLLGAEVREALADRYGAATRVSSGGQVSVTLYSAVPVAGPSGAVIGAVLVSQSTYRILRDLYAIRLDIAWIFLGSLVAAAALSFLLAFTIVSPLRRLGAAAAAALSPAGGRPEAAAAFPETRRADEIGDLQRSLRALALRLDERMRQLERFAADAAHEFRNPLAAIRSAAELALAAPDLADRARFLGAIIDDSERLRATVDGLRRLSLAEAGAGSGAAVQVDAAAAARAACEGVRLRAALVAGPGGDSRRVDFKVRGGGTAALVDPSALDVMLANLLDNAAAFAPSSVEVDVSAEEGFVVVAVEDDGPGFPPEHLGRAFDRFFTWRPGERKGAHTGLGLSLVKALAESGGGRVEASNRPGGGARLVLRLPAAK
jgi:two-component system, OmpR family, sensor histidine kinase ChvG